MARPRKVTYVKPEIETKPIIGSIVANHYGEISLELGDTVTCCGQSFILSTPKGNRCAVCNTRYYPDDSPYKPQ